ncbi:hypothetical protein F5Y15DRAFT_146219 [Xylariaceae sp. FL0016]|nr:hypothetical protein F5Y15DRAFT_146219 [Xylariaceae sp. FL0016]
MATEHIRTAETLAEEVVNSMYPEYQGTADVVTEAMAERTQSAASEGDRGYEADIEDQPINPTPSYEDKQKWGNIRNWMRNTINPAPIYGHDIHHIDHASIHTTPSESSEYSYLRLEGVHNPTTMPRVQRPIDPYHSPRHPQGSHCSNDRALPMVESSSRELSRPRCSPEPSWFPNYNNYDRLHKKRPPISTPSVASVCDPPASSSMSRPKSEFTSYSVHGFTQQSVQPEGPATNTPAIPNFNYDIMLSNLPPPRDPPGSRMPKPSPLPEVSVRCRHRP